MPKKSRVEQVLLQKFVPSGQSIGELNDGRKVFVWGGLPGEKVLVEITKSKKHYAQGIVSEVIDASEQRQEPRDEAYLSTSPWQIVPWELENIAKQKLLQESFEQESIEGVNFGWTNETKQWHYRNKMEFSFWWDHDTGLELAFHKRGTNTKIAVKGSSLADEIINKQAVALKERLAKLGFKARQLKTIILRSTRQGAVFGVLYVKDTNVRLPESLLGELSGLKVYFSNPRSPASVATKLLKTYGEQDMHDTINSKNFMYSAESFFQVNIPVYEKALTRIKEYIDRAALNNILDLYSGVGSIGLSVGANVLVEQDPASALYAKKNSHNNEKIIISASENNREILEGEDVIIVDPPRAGMHPRLVEALIGFAPKSIVYLSCNPATQARDIARLPNYKIVEAHGYNFFPKTPHIESLVMLEQR